jgi:hypothetical protein
MEVKMMGGSRLGSFASTLSSDLLIKFLLPQIKELANDLNPTFKVFFFFFFFFEVIYLFIYLFIFFFIL